MHFSFPLGIPLLLSLLEKQILQRGKQELAWLLGLQWAALARPQA